MSNFLIKWKNEINASRQLKTLHQNITAIIYAYREAHETQASFRHALLELNTALNGLKNQPQYSLIDTKETLKLGIKIIKHIQEDHFAHIFAELKKLNDLARKFNTENDRNAFYDEPQEELIFALKNNLDNLVDTLDLTNYFYGSKFECFNIKQVKNSLDLAKEHLSEAFLVLTQQTQGAKNV